MNELDRARALIKTIPDYPQPGVLFRDISPLLADAQALRAITDALAAPFEGRFDYVAGIEARGFLIAAAVAARHGAGVVPIRKAGKLPRPAARVEYALEYGAAAVEMHDDLQPGARVLLVDDVLATGGTLAAGGELLETLGADVVGTAVLIELEALNGRAVVGDPHLVSLFAF